MDPRNDGGAAPILRMGKLLCREVGSLARITEPEVVLQHAIRFFCLPPKLQFLCLCRAEVQRRVSCCVLCRELAISGHSLLLPACPSLHLIN